MIGAPGISNPYSSQATTLVSNSGCGARGFARGASARGAARDTTCSSGNLSGSKAVSLNRARYRKPTPKKSIDKGKSLKIYHDFLSIV